MEMLERWCGAASRTRCADDVDRVFVRSQVTLGIRERTRALAQHVERAQSHLGLARAARQRLFDAASDDEFTADDAHRTAHGEPHQRFARLAPELADPRRGIGLDRGIEFQHAAGQHQAPGRCVDEQRFGFAGMRRPVAGGELLGNQPVGGRIVGNPQQRFGDAHEGDALLIRQAELLQEGIQKRPLVAARTRAFDQRPADGHCPVAGAAGQFQRMQQALDRLILGPQSVLPGCAAQQIRCSPDRRIIQAGGHSELPLEIGPSAAFVGPSCGQ